MKIDTRYGSIWDELPAKSERRVPQTQEEAMDLYEAAKSSVNHSLMKTWDKHNDMMKKSAELRKIAERKKAVEMFAEAAEESEQRRKIQQLL